MKKGSTGKILFNILMILGLLFALGVGINFYFAVGYLLILFIHEMGHYFAAKLLNLEVAFGGLTPFGAYIVHEDTENCKENAIVAICGPLSGGILGLVFYAIYSLTGGATFFILCFTSIMLNLVNLIPVKPLDGGHIAETISPVICYIGLPFLMYLFVSARRLKGKFVTLVILIIGIHQTYDFSKRYKKDPYFKLTKDVRIKFIGMYGMLLLSLAFGAIYLHSAVDFKVLMKSI